MLEYDYNIVYLVGVVVAVSDLIIGIEIRRVAGYVGNIADVVRIPSTVCIVFSSVIGSLPVKKGQTLKGVTLLVKIGESNVISVLGAEQAHRITSYSACQTHWFRG